MRICSLERSRICIDRIFKPNYNKILEAKPNSLKYFDDQNYDMYPLTNHPKIRGGINESMLPYGRKMNYEKIIIKKEDTTNQNVK